MIQESEREGNLIWPLLIDNVTTNMRIAWEEPFGPIIPVIRIKTPQEGIDHCNASKLALQVISNPSLFKTRVKKLAHLTHLFADFYAKSCSWQR